MPVPRFQFPLAVENEGFEDEGADDGAEATESAEASHDDSMQTTGGSRPTTPHRVIVVAEASLMGEADVDEAPDSSNDVVIPGAAV